MSRMLAQPLLAQSAAKGDEFPCNGPYVYVNHFFCHTKPGFGF